MASCGKPHEPLFFTAHLTMLNHLMSLRWVGMAVVWSLAAASAEAQSDPLGELVREAWANNRALLQARLAAREREAGVRQARGFFLPSLALDARWTEREGGLDLGDAINPAYAALNQLTGENRFPTDLELRLPQRQDMRLRVVQPLLDFSIIANHRLAQGRRDEARERLAGSTLDIAAQVQLTYLQYAAAVRSIEILENARGILDENLRVSERMVASGTATPDAVSRARADRAAVIQQAADAARRRDAAARGLNQLLGRPVDRPAALLSDSLLRFPLDSTPEALVHHALTARPELREADATIRSARASVRLATAGLLPSLAVAVDYGFSGNQLRFSGDNDLVMGTVALQWTPFRGGRDQARRDEALLALERTGTARRDLEETVGREVRNAWDAARVAREAIATAGERLAAASRTFELVRRRYEEGLASHLEFTQARADHTNAGLNELLTRYSYAARAVELERAAALRQPDPE